MDNVQDAVGYTQPHWGEEAAVENRYRWATLSFSIFLVSAFVGRRFFDNELVQNLWVMGSGVIGLVLSLTIRWVVIRLRKRSRASAG